MKGNNLTYYFAVIENVTNETVHYCSHPALKGLLISCMVLSVLCILATILVYICINETRNLHGKVLISLSICLGISYSLLIVDLYIQPYISFMLCKVIGTITYIAFISSFSWSNVITYDIWKTTSTMRQRSQRHQRRKYLKFTMYVSTITILASIPTIIFDNTELIELHFRPNIGTVQCWLKGYNASLIYLSLPIGIILISNLIMFILTMVVLIRIKNEMKILQMKQDKYRFHLYFKLFLAFGLIWLTEFIPFIINVCIVHAVVDILNSLHGLFLFIIFVCKKRVLQQLLKSYASHNFFHFKSRQALNEENASDEITVVSDSFKYITTKL